MTDYTFVQRLEGNDEQSNYGSSVALSGDGNRMIVGEQNYNLGQGRIYIYDYDTTLEQWKINTSDLVGEKTTQDQFPAFGASIALNENGNRIVVGSPGFEESQGKVYPYEYNDVNETWEIRGDPTDALRNNFPSDTQQFGFSVAIDKTGDCIAVGAPGNDKVLVYRWNDSESEFNSPVEIFASNEIPFQAQSFGQSLALNGNGTVLAVGQPSDYGNVYVYKYNDDNKWQPKGDIFQGGTGFAGLGTSLDLSNDGNVLIIGAPFNKEVQVHYFNDTDNEWKIKGTTEILGGDGNFGISTQISDDGNQIAVSNSEADQSDGQIITFSYNDDAAVWQFTDLVNGDAGQFSLFGQVIALSDSGKTLVGTEPNYSNESSQFVGAVRAFSSGQETIPCFIAGSLVTTDQGLVPIETVKAGKHTIRGNEIINTTGLKSQNVDGSDYLVCIKPSALDNEIPFKETICSPLHIIYYNGKMIHAGKLLDNGIAGISKLEYKGEKLYNIQLKEYSHMEVNGMRVETLHPRNVWAKKTIRK